MKRTYLSKTRRLQHTFRQSPPFFTHAASAESDDCWHCTERNVGQGRNDGSRRYVTSKPAILRSGKRLASVSGCCPLTGACLADGLLCPMLGVPLVAQELGVCRMNKGVSICSQWQEHEGPECYCDDLEAADSAFGETFGTLCGAGIALLGEPRRMSTARRPRSSR